MSRVGIIFFLLTLTWADIATSEINKLRDLYRKAATKEEACVRLSKISIPVGTEHASVTAGYKAAATMMMAKYVFNPVSKVNYFRKGKKLLEQIIAADGGNVELRFLRFTIQTNAPSFLGYDNNIQDDLRHLNKSLPKLDDEVLKDMITKYLKNYKA